VEASISALLFIRSGSFIIVIAALLILSGRLYK